NVRKEAARATAAEQQIAKERDQAVLQSERADKQAAIWDALETFDLDMIESADPLNTPGHDITVLEFINLKLQHLDAGALKDQPLLEATIRNYYGKTLNSLGRYAEAEKVLRESVRLF